MKGGNWLLYLDLDIAVNKSVAEELMNITALSPGGGNFLPSFLAGLVEDPCEFVA